LSSRLATVHSEALPGGPAPARAQLVVVEGPDKGRAVSIDQDEVVVGTDASCGLVLTDDRVSHRHASIRREAGRYMLRDLQSRKGTTYEGSRVVEALVPAGATFRVGKSFVRIQPQARALDVPPSQSRRFGDLVGESLAIREVFAVLELAARSDVTVLLEGETGTGKELAARAIHDASARRRGPFVAIDCGALPESLMESELFGHVRGAFTGASGPRAGAFARANGGTLFLDELGGVPLTVQARLLRAIEERTVRPVGGDEEKALDVRIVAASRDDLSARVADGSFRSDLFYRLSVVRVLLPPLRSRREDIPPIVSELLRRRGIEAGSIAGAGLDALTGHGWPGNVRELRNVIDRAVALTPGARTFVDLRIDVVPQPSEDGLTVRSDLPFGEAKAAVLEVFESRYLRDLWQRCEGNVSAAARASGIDRKHLRTLLRKHGIVS
jgi:DNA-binding NtrC family response regulator